MKKLINKIRFWFFIRRFRKSFHMTHKQANELTNQFLARFAENLLLELCKSELRKSIDKESKVMSAMN